MEKSLCKLNNLKQNYIPCLKEENCREKKSLVKAWKKIENFLMLALLVEYTFLATFYGCCDHYPAPFSYFVRQKQNFHQFPLFVGTLSPLLRFSSSLQTRLTLKTMAYITKPILYQLSYPGLDRKIEIFV